MFFFACWEKSFHAALDVFLQKSPKNANYEEFLTKFVNFNNQMHVFLHGVLILQDAKNHSHYEEIFEARQKNNFL